MGVPGVPRNGWFLMQKAIEMDDWVDWMFMFFSVETCKLHASVEGPRTVAAKMNLR